MSLHPHGVKQQQQQQQKVNPIILLQYQYQHIYPQMWGYFSNWGYLLGCLDTYEQC